MQGMCLPLGNLDKQLLYIYILKKKLKPILCASGFSRLIIYTLNKVQKILPFFGKSENSDQSFIMGIYEKSFLGFLSVWKKLLVVPSNT